MTPSQLRDRASRINRAMQGIAPRVRQLRQRGATQAETRPLVDLAGRWFSYARRETAPAFPRLELVPLSWAAIDSTLQTFERDYSSLEKRYGLASLPAYQSTTADVFGGLSSLAWVAVAVGALYLVSRRRG